MIDPTKPGVFLGERLILGSIQHPHHRTREKTNPMTAKVYIGLFAREQEKAFVRETSTLLMHRLEQGKGLDWITPQPAKTIVEFCEMDNLYAGFFEYVYKVRLLERRWHTSFVALLAFLD